MGRRESGIFCGVFAALLLVGTLVWTSGRESHGLPTADAHADAEYYYVYLPALLRGDLDFTKEYRETRNWYSFGTTPTGRPSNVFGIGPALVNAPFFLLGHAMARVSGDRRDGFSRWEVRLYTWASLPWSLGAVAVAYRLVRRRLGGGALALAGPVIAALAGPVAYYAVRQPGYAHPMATFFSALLVERWDASYGANDASEDAGGQARSLRRWVELGALLGLSALVRPQLALWGVLLVHAAGDDWRRCRKTGVASVSRVGRWTLGAAVALAVFSPQLLAWKVLYGRWYLVPQGAHFMRWDDPCWSEVLFSSRNGLFPWSPAYVLFFAALLVGLRRLPRLVSGLVLGVALQAVANGAAWDWWAGGSFGGRRFDSAYLAFAVGASLLVAWAAEAIAPAVRREATAALRARGVAAVLGLLIVLDLVAANLILTGSYVVTTARIDGGEAAARVIRGRVGANGRAALSWPAAWLSGLSNLPVRAIFAWRHQGTLKDYDRIVGVHVLGETYPGLNGPEDAREAQIEVNAPGNPILRGLSPGTGDTAVVVDGQARVLVVLNREDRIQITTRVDGSGVATLRWNGRQVLQQDLGTGRSLRFSTDDVRREANELTLEAPPGTVVHPIHVEALP